MIYLSSLTAATKTPIENTHRCCNCRQSLIMSDTVISVALYQAYLSCTEVNHEHESGSSRARLVHTGRLTIATTQMWVARMHNLCSACMVVYACAHARLCMRVCMYDRACACACTIVCARAHVLLCVRVRIYDRVCACAYTVVYARAHVRL